MGPGRRRPGPLGGEVPGLTTPRTPFEPFLTRLRDLFARPAAQSADEVSPAPGDARRLRVGIDVGGTFTHAVALDARTLELVARSKVPTTHGDPQGVAAGVVQALASLLERAGIRPDQISLIAHSTTQATNALLEGDVAPVGILAMAKGADVWIARRATRVGNLELAPGRFLRTFHRFLNLQHADDAAIDEAFQALEADGAEAFVVTCAFGV
ncbi:MAG: hypothetical protein KGR26_02765, partial [Cyanobacteria bacterium REEB65]|nr:hypothetical protein [Cyanobacteria bacterium REEB65]